MDIIVVVIVIGCILGLITIMNSSSFRDPTKADVISISQLSKEELTKYPEICFLSTSFSRSTFSRTNREYEEKIKIYSLYLLNPNHRKKIKVGGFETKEEAKKRLIEISEQYNKTIVKYNPQISAKSRKRR